MLADVQQMNSVVEASVAVGKCGVVCLSGGHDVAGFRCA